MHHQLCAVTLLLLVFVFKVDVRIFAELKIFIVNVIGRVFRKCSDNGKFLYLFLFFVLCPMF